MRTARADILRAVRYTIGGATFLLAAMLAVVVLTAEVSSQSGDDATPTPRVLQPVNPPGEIPAILADRQGNNYEVFTPEDGGAFYGEDFSFVAAPADLPSVMVIGIRMFENGAASNEGVRQHRYTFGGSLYSIRVVDAEGAVIDADFRFRSPPTACLPLPPPFRGRIDAVAMIATDEMAQTQTVLTSDVRIDDDGLSVCGYVGTVPVDLAVGVAGSPPVPTPTVDPESAVMLPVTGGGIVGGAWLWVLGLVVGLVLVGSTWMGRTGRIVG